MPVHPLFNTKNYGFHSSSVLKCLFGSYNSYYLILYAIVTDLSFDCKHSVYSATYELNIYTAYISL